MPSFSYGTKLRAVSDHYGLNLIARHRLVVGTPSCRLYPINKARLPECVDVRLLSNLIITLSGTVDGSEIPAIEIVASSLARHFVDYLQMNASSLGLNSISKLWIDDDDGLLKLTLTSSRKYPLKPELLPVHVSLVGLDLCYSWQTSSPSVASTQPQWESHPFSQQLSLPFRTLLDNAVGRFVTWQLVRRYPLVFGQWCQQLDTETSLFPYILSSVLRIMKRSSNLAFRAKCERLIKVMRRHHTITLSKASSRLANYLRDIPEADNFSFDANWPLLKDEDVLWLTLERMYRDGMRRRQFKGLVGPFVADYIDDEDLSQDHIPLTENPSSSDEHLSWDDPSMKPPTHTCSEPLFFGNTTSTNHLYPHMSNHYDQDPLGDVLWSDSDELSFGSGDDNGSTYSGLNKNGIPNFIHVDLQDNKCVTPPAVFSFSDDDLFDPFQFNQQTSCPNIDQDEFAESQIQYLIHDHVLSQGDGYEQNTEVVAGHEVGLFRHPAVLSQSQVSSTIADPISHQEDNRDDNFSSRESSNLPPEQTQSTIWSEPRDKMPCVPSQFPIDVALCDFVDIEMDGIQFDTVSTAPKIMESASREQHYIEEFDDNWEDLLLAGIVLPKEDYSHPATTPVVTCPSTMYQVRYQEGGEDEESRLKQDSNSTLDWGVSAGRDMKVCPMENWSEDGLLVMDF